MITLSWLWFVCLMVLTGYHLVIFKSRRTLSLYPFQHYPGVTVVIALKNNSSQLEKTLSAISKQDYPLYDILIVDDHSNEAEKELLAKIISQFHNVRTLIPDVHGKKNAITHGIQNARHELILCTDADCQPVSDQWIKTMVQAGRGAQMVLGYSPYINAKGWLNKLIRFETVMTAIQYVSWANSGQAYMGVGRNLLFHKILFLKTNPHAGSGLLYGDDDLFVQKAASAARINTCIEEIAHVESIPEDNFNDWIKQKHRHMSASYEYNVSAWLKPGIYGMALVMHWLLIPALILILPLANCLPVLLAGILIRWINYAMWTKKLGSRDTVLWYIFLEIQYAIYLVVLGLISFLRKKKTWN